MSAPKLTAAQRRLLALIAAHESHRGSQRNYDVLRGLGLVEHIEWHGWEPTDAGRAALRGES